MCTLSSSPACKGVGSDINWKSTVFYLDVFGPLAPSGHARTSSWNLWNLWYLMMYCAVLSGVQWACLPFVAACFVLLTVLLAWLAWVGGLVGLGNLCRPCFCTMYSYHVLPAGLSQSWKRLHKPQLQDSTCLKNQTNSAADLKSWYIHISLD